MARLPVLLVGASAGLCAVLEAVRPEPMGVLPAGYAVAAVLLVGIAFRMRSGHAGWVPFAAIVVPGAVIVGLRATLAGWQEVPDLRRMKVKRAADPVVPAFCLVLLHGGMRGWWWLRQRGIRPRL